MKSSRQAETQRFPLISLSVTQNHPHIIEASNAGFDIFWGLALRVWDGIQAEITTLKRKMDNKDPENEDPSNVDAKYDWMVLT